MSYQWPLEAEEMFGERYPQMVNTGLPVQDVDAVCAAITEMWPDAPGGWVHEWSALGARYADAGSHDLAALAYGWAKFPTLADEAKRTALARQIEQYQLAAPGFGVDFYREVLELPYRGGTTKVPVHVLTPPGAAQGPVLLFSGGVDSWKMDLHALVAVFCLHANLRVLAFDIPGTGESQVPMSPDGAQIVGGLIDHARTLGDGVVVHVGISMGGHYSARSGLAGEVDAAIVLGGPVEGAFAQGRLSRFGMDGIVGNALGYDEQPPREELAAALAAFSLRPLLDRNGQAPMLVVNGADDVHVPQADTLVFQGRRDTEVHLLPDTGHCAVTKLPEVLQIISEWLPRTLTSLKSDGSTAEVAQLPCADPRRLHRQVQPVVPVGTTGCDEYGRPRPGPRRSGADPRRRRHLPAPVFRIGLLQRNSYTEHPDPGRCRGWVSIPIVHCTDSPKSSSLSGARNCGWRRQSSTGSDHGVPVTPRRVKVASGGISSKL